MSDEQSGEQDRYVHLESGVPIFTPALEDPQETAGRVAEQTHRVRQDSLQSGMLVTQVILAVLGIAGLGATLWNAWISQENADTAERTLLLSQKTERDARVQNENSLRQARDQFRQDQRPYLAQTTNSTSRPQFQPTHDGLGQILWDYHITNYGKSPAVEVQEEKFMKLANGSWVQSYGAGKVKHVGITMAPTAETMNSVISKPMTANEYRQLTAPKQMGDPISIKVRITYRDLFGSQYESSICLGNNPDFAVHLCEGNYVK